MNYGHKKRGKKKPPTMKRKVTKKKRPGKRAKAPESVEELDDMADATIGDMPIP